MAIIGELPGVKITIEVNGLNAQEYEDQDGPTEDKNPRRAQRRSYKYVESHDNAPFSVVYEVDNRSSRLADQEALGIFLFVDGNQMDSVLWEASRHPGDGAVWRHVVSGARIASAHSGLDFFRKFQFAKVTTVDDAENTRVADDIKVSESLGMIQVYVYSCTIKSNRFVEGRATPAASQDKSFELAEKALKGRAVSHGTSYADGGLIPQTHSVSVHFHPKEPIALYSFKYRSRDALHKELIIPRSPSPQGINGLSDAEIRRLAAERLEDINQQNRQSPILKREAKDPVIKREHAEFYDLTEEPTKREWKKVKIDNMHEAIDLTDD
ncbi:uncharacterized protein CTRU02_203689 [Colletotrichum truncatum]|uniref:Uncharacterized protein n=1 Tax=Colletotrichum truncatum TaxID=5467 RepID=A0ACC3ZA48_COLTU|nr:uncharacterized protein CTRU02_04021 [Colletotrichum truncatum]KAF6796061.1 hypothetical protein CTRU02_04021 [Colletotrichum truncatum]